MKFPQNHSWLEFGRLGLMLLIYVALSFGIGSLASDSSYISLFWPCSGLAIGALLLGGVRYAPVIFSGELLGNTLAGYPAWVALLVGLINVSEYLTSYLLLKRQPRFDPELSSQSDYLRLVLTSATVGLPSALLSSLLLLQAGFLTMDTLPSGLLHWWQGDVMGIILVAPLVLVWKRLPTGWFSPARRLETLAFLSLTLIAGQIIFMGWHTPWFGDYVRGFMMFVFLVWGATRFGRHGLTLAALVVAVQALVGALRGTGYFAEDFQRTGGQNLWLYMITLSLVGIVLVIRVESLQQTQAVLRQSRRRLIDLIQQSQRVREEERKHIAAEIHDEIGQTLTAIKLESIALKRSISDEATRSELDHLAALADRSIKVVRNIAKSLRPPALDLGLLQGIKVLVEGFERNANIACETRFDCATVDIPSYIAVTAYRVIQESLTNIARHADATRVVISLQCGDGKMTVSVQDDGCGFNYSQLLAQGHVGLGLLGMEERVETVGGRYAIDSSPGKGTRVEVVLPLNDDLG